MASFQEYIAVSNEILEFEFTEVLCPSDPKYFVKVFKDYELVTTFEMKEHYSKWEIIPPAPEWISEVQPQLERAIHNFRNRM